jgi:hypothetical protein
VIGAGRDLRSGPPALPGPGRRPAERGLHQPGSAGPAAASPGALASDCRSTRSARWATAATSCGCRSEVALHLSETHIPSRQGWGCALFKTHILKDVAGPARDLAASPTVQCGDLPNLESWVVTTPSPASSDPKVIGGQGRSRPRIGHEPAVNTRVRQACSPNQRWRDRWMRGDAWHRREPCVEGS